MIGNIKGIIDKVASRKLGVTAVAGAAAATGAVEITWPIAAAYIGLASLASRKRRPGVHAFCWSVKESDVFLSGLEGSKKTLGSSNSPFKNFYLIR